MRFFERELPLDVSDDGSGLVRNRTNRADDRLISLPLEVVITTPVVAPAILARNSIEMRLARSPNLPIDRPDPPLRVAAALDDCPNTSIRFLFVHERLPHGP